MWHDETCQHTVCSPVLQTDTTVAFFPCYIWEQAAVQGGAVPDVWKLEISIIKSILLLPPLTTCVFKSRRADILT